MSLAHVLGPLLLLVGSFTPLSKEFFAVLITHPCSVHIGGFFFPGHTSSFPFII